MHSFTIFTENKNSFKKHGVLSGKPTTNHLFRLPHREENCTDLHLVYVDLKKQSTDSESSVKLWENLTLM